MSRVHIKFKKIHFDTLEQYEVLCPDFNAKHENEIIGVLNVDLLKNRFFYCPIEIYKKTFCPPELFVEFGGDMELVENKCEELNLYYVAWSYFIYQKAQKILAKSKGCEAKPGR